MKPRTKRSILSRIVRRIIMVLYRWKGWKIDGGLPRELQKYVIAGAPHTSNWDFVFFTGATAEEGIEPNFMGKHTLFQGVMKNFMYDMGGIPVDRSKRANVTQQVAEEYARRDHLALVIAAEGTRSSNGEWRSGFYNIARAANVPIVAAWVDNACCAIAMGWRGKVGTTAVPSSIRFDARPATAIAVMASMPKMFASQPLANPSRSACCTCATTSSIVAGLPLRSPIPMPIRIEPPASPFGKGGSRGICSIKSSWPPFSQGETLCHRSPPTG